MLKPFKVRDLNARPYSREFIHEEDAAAWCDRPRVERPESIRHLRGVRRLSPSEPDVAWVRMAKQDAEVLIDRGMKTLESWAGKGKLRMREIPGTRDV